MNRLLLKKGLIYFFIILGLSYTPRMVAIPLLFLVIFFSFFDGRFYPLLILPLINYQLSIENYIYLGEYLLLFIYYYTIKKDRLYLGIYYFFLLGIAIYVLYYFNQIDNLYLLIISGALNGLIALIFIFDIGVFHNCKGKKECHIIDSDIVVYSLLALSYGFGIMFQQSHYPLLASITILGLLLYKNNYHSLIICFLIIGISLFLFTKESALTGTVTLLCMSLRKYYFIVLIPICYFLIMPIGELTDFYFILSNGVIIYIFLEKHPKENFGLYISYQKMILNDVSNYFSYLLNTAEKEKNRHSFLRNEIENIYREYCNNCFKKEICSGMPGKRFHFLQNSLLNQSENTLDCPNQEFFKSNTPISCNPDYHIIQDLDSLMTTLIDEEFNKLRINKKLNDFEGYLLKMGVLLKEIKANLNSSSIEISLLIEGTKEYVYGFVLKLANCYFQKNLRVSITSIAHNDIEFIIFEEAKLVVTYAHTILPKEQNIISGDNFYVKKSKVNSYLFALSDGMGTGKSAYDESSKMLNIIAKMEKYHFSPNLSLKLLKTLYALRSEHDSYATLDYLKIDAVAKEGTLYKMGSSTTYFLSKGNVKLFENKSLPSSIDDSITKTLFYLNKNDYILLLSDGVTDAISDEEIKGIMKSYCFKRPNEIIDILVHAIKEKWTKGFRDDLSIIAIKIA